MDLYEILSIDNGKVLDSFLKAEHNQPQQKLFHVDFNCTSVNIILEEVT